MTLLEKLQQMRTRLKGPTKFPPPSECPDTKTHIAGAFLRLHIDEIIEAVKRAG